MKLGVMCVDNPERPNNHWCPPRPRCKRAAEDPECGELQRPRSRQVGVGHPRLSASSGESLTDRDIDDRSPPFLCDEFSAQFAAESDDATENDGRSEDETNEGTQHGACNQLRLVLILVGGGRLLAGDHTGDQRVSLEELVE